MSAFLPVAFALLLGLALIYKLFKISIFKEKPAGGIPNGSTRYFPLLGETLSFIKPHESNSPGSFLQEHCSKYGSIFKSHLFGRPTIVSCDLELNMFILQNEEKLFESSYPKPVHDILGRSSMMLVSGELHKKLRSVAVSFINASKSRPDFIHYVDNLCISFINSWKTRTQVLFFKEAKELTFYLMLKSLVSIEGESPLGAQVLEDFLSFMEGFVSLPLYIPGTAYSKAINARRRISSTLKDIIIKRRVSETHSDAGGDFVDEILGNVWLNDDERVSVLVDLLLAGYETTSGLMGLVVYFLAQAPSSLQKLQEEHKVLRKRKKDNGEELLNWEDYKNMEFTSHVLNEALRCGNLVKFVHRKALKDVKFKEYIIPEGWQVLPIILATNLDHTLHENPSEFNPWRWVDPTTSRKVTPYGGGLRMCPGAELGKMEAAFFLHHFVLNFRVENKRRRVSNLAALFGVQERFIAGD
ncbi:hypothetical protein OROHE_017536 [Orobanche hederae]